MRSKKRKCIVVLGMHRSGTSAVAGSLARLGVEFGENLLPAEPFNPKGFYENVEILGVNEEILRTLNSSFDDARPLRENWHRSVYVLPFKEKLKEIIQKEFGGAPVFGFKDPRISILLPLYLELIREMNLDARFVVCERPAAEIALSLKERIGFSLYQSLLLCKKYKQAIEEGIVGQKYVRVAMGDFVSHPEKSIHLIVDTLKLPVGMTAEKIKDIKEFVDMGLKHHTLSTEEAFFGAAKELDESESEKSAFEERSEKLQGRIQELEHFEQQTYRLHNTLAHRDHRIQFLERDFVRLNELESEVSHLREKQGAIERSFSWKVVSRFQRLADAVISPGSFLRMPYVKLLRKLQKKPNEIQDRKALRRPRRKALVEPHFPERVDILFVNHEESLTGAPKILFEIAKEVLNNYSIIVISKQKGGMSEDYKMAFGEKLFYPNEILNERERHAMARIMLENIKPRLVYANSIISYEYACEAKKLGIPVIFHIHEMASAYDVAVAEESQAVFASFADIFITVSEATKSDLVKIMNVPKEKVALVHEFVDGDAVRGLSVKQSRTEVEDILGIASDDTLIVSIGTFDRRKGADLFVKIAEQLSGPDSPQKAKIKMLWIGRRPRQYDTLASAFDSSRNAFLHLDETKNPFPFLARADIFFLPSREDPFPLVVLEAMALKKPVVAFAKSGGAGEAGHGSIILVDNFNTDRAARILSELALNTDERHKRGEEGHIRQKLFEKAPLLQKILSEIDKIIPDGHGSINAQKQ